MEAAPSWIGLEREMVCSLIFASLARRSPRSARLSNLGSFYFASKVPVDISARSGKPHLVTLRALSPDINVDGSVTAREKHGTARCSMSAASDSVPPQLR